MTKMLAQETTLRCHLLCGAGVAPYDFGLCCYRLQTRNRLVGV